MFLMLFKRLVQIFRLFPKIQLLFLFQVADGEVPVDTAVMKDQDGMLVLKMTLDLRGFEPENFDIDIGNDFMTLTAHQRNVVNEDEEVARTKIRKFDLPENVRKMTFNVFAILFSLIKVFLACIFFTG